MTSSKNILDEISKLNNELIDTQRELQKKNAELAALNNYKNEILGMAAHDLRNPLSIITMYLKFLDQNIQKVSPTDQKKILSKIASSSEFMLNLVNDILDLAQIESGKLNLNLTLVDLNESIQNNISMNQVIGNTKKILIKMNLDEKIPLIQIDQIKFEQVLNNLIGNAIKYSPPKTIIEVITKKNPTEILIEVKDQGPGIPENEIKKIFKAFCKTTAQTTGGEKSTGLGLTIAKKIVEGHGGRIWVESSVGKGTSFFVSLPLDKTN